MTEIRVHFYVDIDLDEVIGRLWDTPLKYLIDYETSQVDRIDTD